MLEAGEEELQKTSGPCVLNKHYLRDYYSFLYCAHGSPLGIYRPEPRMERFSFSHGFEAFII